MRKRLLVSCFMLNFMLILSACGSSTSVVSQTVQEKIENTSMLDESSEEITAPREKPEIIADRINIYDKMDVDLTTLSSTMVYSEVYSIMCYPDEYLDKTIRMNGAFSFFQNEETGQQYFACIISDATACCSQGIEFVLDGEYVYPDDYPTIGDEITVSGIFETYEEDGYMYCRLKNAKLEKIGK